MGSFHTNPFVFVLGNQLTRLIGKCPVFTLDHVADIDLIANEGLYRGIGPLMIDAARVRLALPLIVENAGRLNTFFIQNPGNLTEGQPRCSQGKDTAHDWRGFFVDDKMVLVRRVPFIAKRRICTHKFSILRTGFFDGFYLFTCVSAVKFVK